MYYSVYQGGYSMLVVEVRVDTTANAAS